MLQHHQKGALQTATAERFGPIIPRYDQVAREAGSLAIGELVQEPYLGLARVNGINVPEPGSPFVQVHWKDDYSHATAAARYPADMTLPVRIPAQDHRLHIEQGINQAVYIRRELARDIARLIAVHLHQGPKTAIYRFARDGAIRDPFYDELDDISRHQPGYKSWINALASYALARPDSHPIPGWRADEPMGTTDPAEANVAMMDMLVNSRRRPKKNRAKVSEALGAAVTPAQISNDHLPTADASQESVREAFVLGLQAASKTGAPRARKIITAWQRQRSE